MMDSLRKQEILKAEDRFRSRTLFSARLAEQGFYLVGPLCEISPAPESEGLDDTIPATTPSPPSIPANV